MKTIFQNIILSVKMLHQKGITHRDIKPDNILMASLENIRLCDFSSSVSADAIRGNLYPHGVIPSEEETLNYAPPEVRLEAYFNETNEVWSCLIVFYVGV
jgi:serine/threonine protein kinase